LGPNKRIKTSSSRQVFQQHPLSNTRPSSHKVKDKKPKPKNKKKFRKHKEIVKVKKQYRKFPILLHRVSQKVTPGVETSATKTNSNKK